MNDLFSHSYQVETEERNDRVIKRLQEQGDLSLEHPWEHISKHTGKPLLEDYQCTIPGCERLTHKTEELKDRFGHTKTQKNRIFFFNRALLIGLCFGERLGEAIVISVKHKANGWGRRVWRSHMPAQHKANGWGRAKGLLGRPNKSLIGGNINSYLLN